MSKGLGEKELSFLERAAKANNTTPEAILIHIMGVQNEVLKGKLAKQKKANKRNKKGRK